MELNPSPHIKTREKLLGFLKEELVGPSLYGKEINCSEPIHFSDGRESFTPKIQKGTGEEILVQTNPLSRYGVGILFPINTKIPEQEEVTESSLFLMEEVSNETDQIPDPEILSETTQDEFNKIQDHLAEQRDDSVGEDFSLALSNAYRPSSLGISFLADFPDHSQLVVEVTGGRYIPKVISYDIQRNPNKENAADIQKERNWWLRTPVHLLVEFDGASLRAAERTTIQGKVISETGLDSFNLQVEAYTRSFKGASLITVYVVNRNQSTRIAPDSLCLFQTSLKAEMLTPQGDAQIRPYPTTKREELDSEEQSMALLYREVETYAVGHGCAANWEIDPASQKARWVTAECLPVCETPSITAEIRDQKGNLIEVSMGLLAGLVPGRDGFLELNQIVSFYEYWIEEQRQRIPLLAQEHQATAMNHLQECVRSAHRMRNGIVYLQNNPMALKAFQLANYAMLLQQLRSSSVFRKAKFDPTINRLVFDQPLTTPDPLVPDAQRGKWRPFQLAFFLMSLQSAVDPQAEDRKTVDLIWFPTGGGKTEAYLGLASFVMFLRRLTQPGDAGCTVLMRYTLRLLTAQQFQRASGLICAMEYLRRQNENVFGREPFSIGIWMGGDTTPNTRKEALEILKSLHRGSTYDENKFLVTRCPWCHAQIGPIGDRGKSEKKNKSEKLVFGYEQQGDRVVLACTDNNCEFSSVLPIYVVDDDIYAFCPSLVIGTIDKFATLPWREQARTIFGIDLEGRRFCSPPQLIIQDELHLISGPLGSMAGLYETIIEELCTDRRLPHPAVPKIVCSTATIRRYQEQILALYARNEVALFPSPGLDASDSFFAQFARYPDGTLKPGRMYIGVHAPGFSSAQVTQGRVIASLLQAPMSMTSDLRDPWWTLLLFFNSLRELGTTLTDLQGYIPNYQKFICGRIGRENIPLRHLFQVRELTSRLKSQDIPKAISDLQTEYLSGNRQKTYPIDLCLASNIIEVGIDIDRLSLMAVMGQPKTTSQYIQVTGRVGRKWEEKPGAVVTIYNATRPRDRSHFEKFRTYHERLYAQVEPTSVTPFAPPVLERALHALMVAYVRLVSAQLQIQRPSIPPRELLQEVQQIILKRIRTIDPSEEAFFLQLFQNRFDEWKRWEPILWSGLQSEDAPLMYEAGAYIDDKRRALSWQTPLSMRNVDAECQLEISTLYKYPVISFLR